MEESKKQMAMTQNFVRIATEDTESDYLEYKQLKPEKIIKSEDIEYFDYTILEGYHGYTLACRTKGVYDLYRVYDKNRDLICESEDEIIELPQWYTIYNIHVRAYDRLWEDRIVLLAENNEVSAELPLRDKSDSYKLSVVVPCYKAELFMARTIDSILSSSLSDIELIIVNDWSPEKDLEMAKWYADNYGCVKVIDKPNTWLCDSRNKGLELCRGEFMAFCDADDIIHPLMYERLYNACKENDVEIAISSILIRNQPKQAERSLKLDHDVVYTFDEMMEKKGTEDNIYFVWVWNKIVKTETAKKVWFPLWYIWRSFVYEDIAYTWSLYSYIDRFAYCCDAIYTWEKRKRQTVGTVSTWHKEWDSNEYSWETFIYGASYPLYNKSWKHLEWHDYRHFQRMIESYKKFNTPSPLKTYRDMKLKEIITSQKLNENKLIMNDPELKQIVNRFIP